MSFADRLVTGNIGHRLWLGRLAFAGLAVTTWVSMVATRPAWNLWHNGGQVKTAAPSTVALWNNTSGQSRISLDEAIEFARGSRAALRDVKDYTAVFTKTECVNDRLITQVMDMKFRHQPFSVYLCRRWKGKPGREVLFVDGANGGRLLVREAGLKSLTGTMSFYPDDPKVLQESRHPITEIGLARLLESALLIWEHEERAIPASNREVMFLPSVMLEATECAVVQITHLNRHPGINTHLSRVYFGKDTKFAVLAENYGWPAHAGDDPPLLERYSYSEIRTNPGLADGEFDRSNPAYRFGGAAAY